MAEKRTGASEKSKGMTLGLVQISGNCLAADKFARLNAMIDEAAGKGAGLVVLPELILHDYFCIEENIAHFDLAHDLDAEPMRKLSEKAREKQVVLVVPFFEKRAPGLYHNSAAVYETDGKLAGVYRKMHIPDDPGFFEKYYFTPGDLGFKNFPTSRGNVGVLICWDQWFPEGARLTAMRGAEILCYPTAIGWDAEETRSLAPAEAEALKAKQLDAWVTMHRSHAIANGVYVTAVNRVGSEGHLRFWGNSMVCDPGGEIIGRLGPDEEGVLVVECPQAAIESTRRVWPFLRDRRIDGYEDMTRRFLV